MTTDEGEPGYCIACRDWHMLTPVPEWGGWACQQCKATRRLDPPEEGPRHVCNTSSRHKPGQPEYRRCACGQWFWAGSGYWYRVRAPHITWLREHGMDPAEFWTMDGARPPGPGRDRVPLRAYLSWSFLRWLITGSS